MIYGICRVLGSFYDFVSCALKRRVPITKSFEYNTIALELVILFNHTLLSGNEFTTRWLSHRYPMVHCVRLLVSACIMAFSSTKFARVVQIFKIVHPCAALSKDLHLPRGRKKIAWSYLESPWEMHWNKCKHA